MPHKYQPSQTLRERGFTAPMDITLEWPPTEVLEKVEYCPRTQYRPSQPSGKEHYTYGFYLTMPVNTPNKIMYITQLPIYQLVLRLFAMNGFNLLKFNPYKYNVVFKLYN